MRILILSPRLPWPPTDGGRVAMSRLATSLKRQGATVDVLSLNPRKHRADGGLAPIPTRAIDIDTDEIVRPLFLSIADRLPFIAARFVSKRFRDVLRESLRSLEPDLVQIESPFMLPYLETVRDESPARVVLRSLNVEFRIWETLALRSRNPLNRFALRRAAASLKAYELGALNRVDAVIPISSGDADDFRRLGCTRPVHVAPCGVSIPDPLARSLQAEPATVGFIGSLDFRPNQDAVVWILDQLCPRLRERCPEARLAIAGSSPPAWLLDRALARGVAVQSDVGDAEHFVRTKSVMIAPLFAGGGMRIKVLEAMALGRPVVATALGAGGVLAENGRNILIAEEPDPFVDAIATLLRDHDMAGRIGEHARATVAAHYDSDTIARDLLHFYESL